MPPIDRIRIIPNKSNGEQKFYGGDAVIPVIPPIIPNAVFQPFESGYALITGISSAGHVGGMLASGLVVSGVFGTSGVNSLHDQNQYRITGTSGTSHIGVVAISSSINTSITLSGAYGNSGIGTVTTATT